jgi:hypothetical protein
MRRRQRACRVRWSALECGFAAGEFVGDRRGSVALLLPTGSPMVGSPPLSAGYLDASSPARAAALRRRAILA